MRTPDTFYETDESQMRLLNIIGSNTTYWVASRKNHKWYKEIGSSKVVNWDMYYVMSGNSEGTSFNLWTNYTFAVNRDGGVMSLSPTAGFRPVFIIKSGIKITGGNGTEELPYTLGV